MKDKLNREIFDLVNRGPSGRLKALEMCISKELLGEMVYGKATLLVRMLEDDLHQLEQYILMDMESTSEYDFYRNKEQPPSR